MLPDFIYQPPAFTHLDILFEDEDFVILNKPSGLLSVPGRGEEKQDCLLSRLQTKFTTALTVHRLDLATSGIMIFALNKSMQKSLSQLFEQRKIKKTYTAKVFGHINSSQGTINQPLITDWPNRPKQKIDYHQGKPSITHYKLLSSCSNESLVDLFPITGRSHQLRVHMSSLGHPILGDKLYGIEKSRNASNRLLLHACMLEFEHPVNSKKILIESRAEFI